MRKPLSDSPQLQRHSDPTPPYPARSDPSGHSYSSLSLASPTAARSPMVYLMEGEDAQAQQPAKVTWSVDNDSAINKPIGMLPVKPGTSYTLEVPPQQETVVLKFKTFGKSRF